MTRKGEGKARQGKVKERGLAVLYIHPPPTTLSFTAVSEQARITTATIHVLCAQVQAQPGPKLRFSKRRQEGLGKDTSILIAALLTFLIGLYIV